MASGQIGDSAASGDIYGTGVRLGIYFQVIGLSFSAGVGKAGGVKLVLGATMLGLLLSWTHLALGKEISPAESLTVLSLLDALFIPVGFALLCPKAWVGEGIAIFCCMFAQVWAFAANIWFWAKLYNTLPDLGTPSVTWFWVQVSIDGWFRIFSLVTATIYQGLGTVGIVFGSVVINIAASNAWLEGEDELDDEDQREEVMIRWRGGLIGLSLVAFIFCIAQIEMTIKWNGLTPDNDFSHPGQSIPLVIGIIVLVDGIMALFGLAIAKGPC